MPRTMRRSAVANDLYILLSAFLGSAAMLSYLLFLHGSPAGSLFLFCAASIRGPVEQIVNDYRQRYGVSVQVQYGGSNTLLSQLTISRAGDLYLAADEAYTQLARQKGLTAEVIPLAWMRPVVVVRKGNPKQIVRLDDLTRGDVRVALPNPDAAAIGQKARELLTTSGHWERLESRVIRTGVFKPTVTDVANDVKLGSVDAGIVWDSTVAQYPELTAISVPELSTGRALVEIAVLRSARDPAAALRFARFLSTRDAGLEVFRQHGFDVMEAETGEERASPGRQARSKPRLVASGSSRERQDSEPTNRSTAHER